MSNGGKNTINQFLCSSFKSLRSLPRALILKKELNLMLFNQCLITSAFKGGLLRKKILIRDKQQWSDCLLEKELHGDEVV